MLRAKEEHIDSTSEATKADQAQEEDEDHEPKVVFVPFVFVPFVRAAGVYVFWGVFFAAVFVTVIQAGGVAIARCISMKPGLRSGSSFGNLSAVHVVGATDFDFFKAIPDLSVCWNAVSCIIP